MSEPSATAAAARRPAVATWWRSRGAGSEAEAHLVWRVVWTSRLLGWAAGVVALATLGPTARAPALDLARLTQPFHSALANLLVGPAARWDTVWYLGIARHAYFSRASSAFFPLYPLLVHAGSTVLGSPLLVGVLISLLSTVGALFALHRLTELDLGADVARVTVLLVAFFPTAFFFSAVYTESLYLLLSVGAIYAARLDRWAVASLLGALASAARPNGILVMVALAVMYLYGPRARAADCPSARWWRPRYRLSPSALWLAAVPLGLVAYLAYLGAAHGQPFAPFGTMSYWGRHFAGPFGAVPAGAVSAARGLIDIAGRHLTSVAPGEPLSQQGHAVLDFGFVAFAAVGVATAWRRVPFAYLAYGVAMLAQTLAYPHPAEPLISFPRYVVVIFPLFMGLATRLAGRPRATRWAVAGFGAGLAALSGYWAIWGWVA